MQSDEFRAYVDGLPFFDSHSHMAGFEVGGPVDDHAGMTLPAILTFDYLSYLAPSCGHGVIPSQQRPADPSDFSKTEEHFRSILPLLDMCRGLSTYAAYRESLRELHPFEGEDINLDNWAVINESILRAYQNYGDRGWQRELIGRAKVRRQVQICRLPYVTRHWPSLPEAERKAQAGIIVPALIIDEYCAVTDGARPAGAEDVPETEWPPRTLAEYIDFCDGVLERFQSGGGLAVKILCAYNRPLYFEEVSREEAEDLYARAGKGPEDSRRLEDALYWVILEKVVARRLPVLVHTGYANPTDYGDPEQMRNLIGSPRLADMKIGLCHAGWPNEAGAMVMARSFRACYMDFSWNPLLSPTAMRRMLGEAIDMVPMNRVMLGTDCGTAECFYGTAKLNRRILADALLAKVVEGQFGMPVAQSIARRFLYENACEFFSIPVSDLL